MTVALRRVFAAFALLALLGSAACGESSPKGVQAKDIDQLPPDLVKGPILGLNVAREDVRDRVAEQEANAYIAAVALYSLREGERLEATLQVSKLTDKARPENAGFRSQIANQVGGTKSQAYVMGGKTVYRSSARSQSIASWFQGRYYLVLSVRDTYGTPRSLLRTLISEVKPK